MTHFIYYYESAKLFIAVYQGAIVGVMFGFSITAWTSIGNILYGDPVSNDNLQVGQCEANVTLPVSTTSFWLDETTEFIEDDM